MAGSQGMPKELYEKYKEMHESYLDAAIKTTMDNGDHCPMFILKKGDNLHFLPAPFENDQEKRKFVMICKVAARILEAEAVFFVCESWMSIGKNCRPDVKPSEDPNRVEALFVSLWLKDIGGRMISAEMKRDPRGKLTSIEEMNSDGEFTSMGGLITNLCGEDLEEELPTDRNEKRKIRQSLGALRGEIGIDTTSYKNNYKRTLH